VEGWDIESGLSDVIRNIPSGTAEPLSAPYPYPLTPERRTTGDAVKVQRKHVLAAGVAAVAAAAVAVGTGLGFADTAPARASACTGSVTFSAEGGAPAATSNRFPVGTRLRVTNLDNNRAAEVTVVGPSGSCVLLNTAAMDLVREPGRNVVRRNVVEVLNGGATAPPDPASTRPGAASPGASGPARCTWAPSPRSRS
jgi:hypothetical protein